MSTVLRLQQPVVDHSMDQAVVAGLAHAKEVVAAVKARGKFGVQQNPTHDYDGAVLRHAFHASLKVDRWGRDDAAESTVD